MTTWESLGTCSPLLRVPDDRSVGGCSLRTCSGCRCGQEKQPVTTWRAFLDSGCSTPVPEALSIHRTTGHYRIGRVEELTSVDLPDGRTGRSMHLGLTLLDLVGELRRR